MALAWGLLLGGLALVTPAWAADEPPAEPAPAGEPQPAEATAPDATPTAPISHRDEGVPTAAPLVFEQHLQFRFRPELLLGGDLGGGASGVPEPLANTPRNGGGDANLLAYASIRLRYDAVLRPGPPWGIHLGLTALDNLVLGSSPASAEQRQNRDIFGLYPDAGSGRGADLRTAEERQAYASSRRGSLQRFRDALRVRYLYGSWRILEFLDFAGGRMPDSFGLGIMRNAGDCTDCDYGTYVDGMRLGASLKGFRLEGSWEFTAVGATTDLPGLPGQPTNLGRADDVQTFTLRLVSAPYDAAAREARRRRLDIDRRVAIDWGLFSSFTSQSLSSSEIDPGALDPDCPILAETASGQVAVSHDCWRLIPRDAFFWRPSVWVKSLWHPDDATELRLELEVGAMIGSVGNLQRSPELGDTGKDFRGFGGAMELEWATPRYRLGLDLGFATGDNQRYLGVIDGQNIVVADDLAYPNSANTNVSENNIVSSYWFHRDYRLDLILFRQVIGGVTNAVYVKPWVSWTLLDSGDTRLTTRLDVLYAAAARPSGTPGRGRHYGVEIDGSLGIEMPAGFGLDLSAGLLLPMSALDDRDTGASPSTAFALRGLLTWRY
ncbi:MAG: hypothetical protein H6744_15935 [Deltaproteobacteria bacterium]|nr:hypothetical protein [Deltaproteobacteria bacterium]MCB9788172.1 hypothetical protein [Deltaproteobacteria bacterium]